MRAVVALCVALAACSSQRLVKEVHVREQALFLPEAITAKEPRAERVTILTRTGKTLVYEDAIIGREGDTLMIRQRGEPVQMALADARAVQLERHLVGPDKDHLVARANAREDVALAPTWTIALGIVTLAAATLFTVITLSED